MKGCTNEGEAAYPTISFVPWRPGDGLFSSLVAVMLVSCFFEATTKLFIILQPGTFSMQPVNRLRPSNQTVKFRMIFKHIAESEEEGLLDVAHAKPEGSGHWLASWMALSKQSFFCSFCSPLNRVCGKAGWSTHFDISILHNGLFVSWNFYVPSEFSLASLSKLRFNTSSSCVGHGNSRSTRSDWKYPAKRYLMMTFFSKVIGIGTLFFI